MSEIITGDGKYKTVNNNGILTVYRHGELWRKEGLLGDKYVLSLVHEIEDLLELNNKIHNKISSLVEDISKVKGRY